MASTSDDTGSKPHVFILTLDKTQFFEDMCEDFVQLLKTKAEVKQITTPDEARAAFTSQAKPTAILCADGSLTTSTRNTLLQDARSYAHAGGILVFMGLFSSFSRPPDIDSLFSSLGLTWTNGDYHRTTFKLNPGMKHFDTTNLASRCSQKALHLANVAFRDSVYLPSQDSRVESAVFGPSTVNQSQTPAALAQVGQGKIGYIGDVNMEDETTPVVFGMCGL